MTTDRFVVRVVVLALAGMAVGGLAGGLVLAAFSRPLPDALVAIVSGSAGALSAFLVRSSAPEAEPQPVQVQNTEPIPVDVDPDPVRPLRAKKPPNL